MFNGTKQSDFTRDSKLSKEEINIRFEWNYARYKLDLVYNRMNDINQTDRKSQTEEQTAELNGLRKRCIELHYEQIAINQKRMK